MKSKLKVIAYIFRNQKKEILVFDHRDFPDAGTQVVGGTVENEENLKIALGREILEESGLDLDLSGINKIGESTYHRKDLPEVNYRHYFEIETLGLPESWSHNVRSSGDDDGMVFQFYWLSIEEAKKQLTGNFGEMLP